MPHGKEAIVATVRKDFEMGSHGPGIRKQIDLIVDLPVDVVAVFAEQTAEIVKVTDVSLRKWKRPDDHWQVCIAAGDKPGILSIFHGLLTSEHWDISSGDAIVLDGKPRRPPSVPRGRTFSQEPFSHHVHPRILAHGSAEKRDFPRILATFTVAPTSEVDADYWPGFRVKLQNAVRLFADQNLAAARESFIEYAIKAAADDNGRHHATVDRPGVSQDKIVVKTRPSDGSKPAKLWVLGQDVRGILFEVTCALSMLNVNIRRIRIRSVNGEVRDTIWITDARGRHYTDEGRLYELRECTTLIAQFMRLLARTANPEQALEQFVQLTEDLVARRDSGVTVQRLESEQVLRTLAHVLGSSRFLWDDFLRMQHDNLFPLLVDLPIESRRKKSELAEELAALMGKTADNSAAVGELNRWKDREMFRIDLRHLMGKIEFQYFAEELSDLAELTVEQACSLSHQQLREKYGTPRVGNEICPWCVFGLGKLGGRELGYASDIELMFVYGDMGTTDGPERIANSDYFERFVCDFLRSVQAKRDGIFEVDLRLRPYGSAGNNACSLAAFGKFFHPDGDAEQFQRLALVKLSPISGDPDLAKAVLSARDAFVYSGKAVDYDDILHLRKLQRTQLVPKGKVSAKHSPGGVVDLEYFVQSQQIELGHKEPRVRVSSTRQAIKRLTQVGHLPAALSENLLETYGFLRQLIDALRVVRGNTNDLTLPPPESRSFAYLARRMGYDNPESFEGRIREKMAFVSRVWNFVGIDAYPDDT